MFGITRRKGAAIQLKLDPAYVFWTLVKNSLSIQGEKLLCAKGKHFLFFLLAPSSYHKRDGRLNMI